MGYGVGRVLTLGKPVVGVGVNFSSRTKNIEGWTAAEMAAE
jgi:hypothetical protein